MNLLNKKIEVFNGGYVMLVDVMGSDQDIVRAARVSYDEASTKHTSTDEQLIDYLLRHKHTSPFEMVVLKFEIKLPIFVERQWVRHRTCSMNEISGRYSILPEEYYIPHETVIGDQSKTNKQGRDVFTPVRHQHGEIFRTHVRDNANQAFNDYNYDLSKGIPRELARIQLPLSTYTKKVWQMNLHNLLHFLQLRTDSHAQYEIRQYAQVIEGIVAELFPLTYKSWVNHIKNGANFSHEEIKLVNMMLHALNIPLSDFQKICEKRLGKSKSKEFFDKIDKSKNI